MNNFWTLVKYEHKKIFMRKSVIVGIVIAIVMIIIMAWGDIMGTNPYSGISYYDEMMMNKQKALKISGRKVDDELIYEASQSFAKVYQDSDPMKPIEEDDKYLEYVKPYESIYRMIYTTYERQDNGFSKTDFSNLTKEEISRFYDLRIKQLRSALESSSFFTQSNVDRIIEIDEAIEKPFVIEYYEGYRRFFNMTVASSIVLMVLIAYMITPIFSSEYETGIDSLILTSKNGKKSLIIAKIFTAITINIIVSTMVFIIGYLICMGIYGFNGTNACIQNFLFDITYNFTMIECTMMIFITTIIGGGLMSAISLFLSSFMKPMPGLVICMSMVFMGLLPGGNMEWLLKLKMFLPIKMGSFHDMITQLSWDVLGVEVWLYQAVCIVGVIVLTILIGFGYHNFKNHQVN